jgi:membrane-associated phospholipid phosphatase
VLVRGGHRLATRFAAVTAATVLAGAVGLTRVYLRAEHLSDVVGGLATGTGAFALAGIIAVVVAFVRQNASST